MRPGERQDVGNGGPFVMPEATGPVTAPESSLSGPLQADDSDLSGIPEAVKAAARRAPGHWIGVVDPEWAEERTPPEWAVLGEWQSDGSGGVGEYRANPAYRPSARVLGWPDPTDPVDAAAQRAATGYGPVEDALAALAEAEVSVVRGTDGEPLAAAGRDGQPVILLFTSPAHEFMSAELHHDSLSVRELTRSPRGPGAMLMVNAGAAAPLLVPMESLVCHLSAAGGEHVPAGDPVEAAAKASSAPGGAVDRTGAPDAAAAVDRAHSPSEPWPRTTGRTP
ncbi:type VII secretion system-associated protein [Streptomyces sp. NBC_01341]|uniref:type VII secretion system-associated protein n=1 Tax=Streptomyces sp. NBC_01341 TaxID=2903831 RepID=UPI002E1343E5|nr:type VII secretion system-associated protein [Streptomyces sp. NBC_01341]